MAKPDTPGKRFNEFASQSYWGVESARKTVTTVLYQGPYIDIESGLEKSIKQYIDSPENYAVTKGKITGNDVTEYILHDREATMKFLSTVKNIGLNKNFSDEQINAKRLSFLSDLIGENIAGRVEAVVSTQSRMTDATLSNIYQGIYAFKNSYRVNEDVLFGSSYGEFKKEDLSGYSFVLNVPVARSRVSGRHDHIELVKAKYIGTGKDLTSIVISGKTKEVLMGQAFSESASRADQAKAFIGVLNDQLTRTQKIILEKRKGD